MGGSSYLKAGQRAFVLGNLERLSEKVRSESLLGGAGAKCNRGFVQVAEISAGIQDRCCF